MDKHTIDITGENFQSAVVEASNSVLIVVDFWAPWCGPCKALMPILLKLASEYDGKFVLAKVNVDENQELAAQFNARSVPTVKLVKNGQIVDEFVGAQSEPQLREILDRHIESPQDKMLIVASELVDEGKNAEAIDVLRTANQDEPDNTKVRNALLLLMLEAGQVDEVEQAVASLADKNDEEIKVIIAKISNIRLLENAPDVAQLEQRIAENPDDLEANFQLAAHANAAEDYVKAMDCLLMVIAKDADFQEGMAKQQLLALFDVVPDRELVGRYRRRLFDLLC